MRPLLLLLAFAFLPFGPADGLPVLVDPPADPARESALLAATNAARAAHGLPALVAHEGLARAARAHAHEMAKLGYFSHRSPNPESATLGHRLARAGVPSVEAAENLASLRGLVDIASSAVEGWLESPSHRAALLDPHYTHVGFGAFDSADGTTYVAQVFAREPRRLLGASAVSEPRRGYEVIVRLEVPRRLTVLPRLGTATGEVRTLVPGLSELRLHTSSAERQQLVLGATSGPGRYVIEDGGWLEPAAGRWQADPSMPRSQLRIAAVETRPAAGRVVRLELEYEPGSGQLAALVDGRHYREAVVAPGRLRLILPADREVRVQVGEVSGSTVLPFDAFTLLDAPAGPLLLAGNAP